MNVFDLVAKLTLDKSGYENELNNASKSTSKLGENVGKVAKTVAKWGTGAVIAGATAVTAITKQAVDAYANYEQLVGGVQKLFGTSGQTMEEYAQQQGKTVDEIREEYTKLFDAQKSVILNARDAYKTAGLSANEYMETVTSFSASLIKSLEGDTIKSAEYADMALRDMSDNANTYGSSMESIQNAYQGFAKGNYTMLDNLKLGYGGTATEMAKLINDSGVLGDKMIDLSDATKIGAQLSEVGFAKMVEAIHKVQESMNIAGTTSREAMGTISGSIGMLKASWQNVLTGLASDNDELFSYIDQLVESAGAVAQNLLPVVERAIEAVGTTIETLMPVILERIPALLENLLPKLIKATKALINSLVKVLPQLLDTLKTAIPPLLNDIMSGLNEGLPKVIKFGADLIKELVDSIGNALPDLIPVAIDSIFTFADSLIDNIDTIIDAGISFILGLVDGIMNALPKLMEKGPEIIIKFVEALTRNLPKVLETALYIILALAEGLIKYLPQLLLQIPIMLSNIVKGILAGVKDMRETGVQLVEGLWEGIKKRWENLVQNVKNLGKNLVSTVKGIFDIHSPSRVFENIGEMMVAGLDEGTEGMFNTNGLHATVSADVKGSNTEEIKNNAVTIDYEQLGASVANALAGFSINMDGRTVAQLIAGDMNYQLGVLNARRV